MAIPSQNYPDRFSRIFTRIQNFLNVACQLTDSQNVYSLLVAKHRNVFFVPPDCTGSFWEKGLVLATESYQFLWAYELSSTYEESGDDVTPLELTNSCVSAIVDYFRHQENLPQVKIYFYFFICYTIFC